MISLLCPSKGRASLCHRMVQSAYSTSTKGNIEVILGTVEPYKHITGAEQIKVPEWSTVMTWNHLAQYAKGDLLMLCADDVIFSTPGWDQALLDHYSKLYNKIHVYSLRDSRDAEGVPHPIVSKEWKDAMGWFVPPYFLHWKVDVWTNEIANTNKCFTHMKDYLLIHDKPNDHGRPDHTHINIRKIGWLERDNYVANSCGYLLEYEKRRLAEKIKC